MSNHDACFMISPSGLFSRSICLSLSGGKRLYVSEDTYFFKYDSKKPHKFASSPNSNLEKLFNFGKNFDEATEFQGKYSLVRLIVYFLLSLFRIICRCSCTELSHNRVIVCPNLAVNVVHLKNIWNLGSFSCFYHYNEVFLHKPLVHGHKRGIMVYFKVLS